jgi:hypothetical protein
MNKQFCLFCFAEASEFPSFQRRRDADSCGFLLANDPDMQSRKSTTLTK